MDGTHGSVSYQYGDFDTHRAVVSFRHLHEPTGIFARFNGFYDRTDNDYSIDVEVPNEVGRLQPATVDRFHDAYHAGGANLEVGWVGKPWAEKFLVRGFTRDSDNELQHNVVMTVPYGEVVYGERSTGMNIRYENTFVDSFTTDVVVGFAEETTHFVDVSEYVYNWFGEQVVERLQPGEVNSEPQDNVIWEDTVFARVNLGWMMDSGHELKLSLGPTDVSRTGDERIQSDPDARDPLTAQRDVFSLVSGLELTTRFMEERLESIVFVKDYLQQVRSEEPLPGGGVRDKDRDTHRQGLGGSLRYRVNDWLYTKASFERTIRLPRPDDVFGDAVQIVANLDLEPELSNNLNVGLTISDLETDIGSWRADVNVFFRDTENEIVLLGNHQAFSYQNVFGALSQGVELAAGWTSTEQF